jgi:Domain of unknown function (DUF4131)
MDNAARIGLLCLAYIGGLLVSPHPEWVWGLTILLAVVLYLGNRSKRLNLPISWTAAAAAILLSAAFYCQWRLPQPTNQDISRFINTVNDQGQTQFSSVKGIAIQKLPAPIDRSFGSRPRSSPIFKEMALAPPPFVKSKAVFT